MNENFILFHVTVMGIMEENVLNYRQNKDTMHKSKM